MSFNVCITSVEGPTLNLTAECCKELTQLGATIVPHQSGRVKNVAASIKGTNANTVCVIPPASKHKIDVTAELIEEAKMADIPNFVFLEGICGFGGIVYEG